MRITYLRLWVIFLSVLCSKGLHAQSQFYPVREKMLTASLDGTWKIKIIPGQMLPDSLSNWTHSDFDSNNWQDILVPGNWETQGFKWP